MDCWSWVMTTKRNFKLLISSLFELIVSALFLLSLSHEAVESDCWSTGIARAFFLTPDQCVFVFSYFLDSHMLFNAYRSTGNMFSWDASAALSEASEIGFTRWMNHLFSQSRAAHTTSFSFKSSNTNHSVSEESRSAIDQLLHSPAFTAPALRMEKEVDCERIKINKDLNCRADKG